MFGTAVVAVGGNALSRESGSHAEQQEQARAMARSIGEIIRDGWRVVVVHGNGPQVGNLALQQEAARDTAPAMPLFALGAMTQGQLGSLLVLALHQVLQGRPPVAALVSHVAVQEQDPAFQRPTKPIGPFLSREQAARMQQQRGWTTAPDGSRGHRRVVPSPRPRELLEAEALRCLVEAGHVVVALGGGGVPVTRGDDGWAGVDAVVDKDLAAAMLAVDLGAEALVLLTAVDAAMVGFEGPSPRRLGRIDVAEAEQHLRDGEFGEGSMQPKMTAATRFLRAGGRTAVVTSPDRAAATLRGEDRDGAGLGTRIVAAGSRS